MSSRKANWAALGVDKIIKYFKSDPVFGLTDKEAQKRLNTYGPNKLIDDEKISPIKVFLSQFQDVMVLILIGATLISGMLGEYADALTIFAIIILNAFLGLIQEYRAEKTIEALKKITSPTAYVVRGGEERKVSAEELVPGDVVLLKAGDRVPADLRLIKSMHLEVEESALTGESVPVRKDSQWTAEGKREERAAYPRNMVFMGTLVTRGRGRGIVVSTGMETEVGRIAYLIQEAEDAETPLQKRLAGVGKRLVVLCLVICFFVTAAGIIQGIPTYRMFLAGVSLAVAAVPEGMPAVVTVSLAIGVQKMLKRRALVRKLPAVETLGCATVICSDKTGTLTKNEMTVREIWVDGKAVSVTGEGYSPKGKFFLSGKEISINDIPALSLLLKIAALCNNAKLYRDGISINGLLRRKEKNWSIQGDPTEGALLVAAAKAGIWREHIEEEEERLGEIPFDSERKRMSVIYKTKTKKFIYVKGALDVILGRSSYYLNEGVIKPLTNKEKQKILLQNSRLASKAMRVLAFAYRELRGASEQFDETLENDLVFVGLVAMIDPPRPEAKRAVQKCLEAGIRVVMITGDHPETALAVAKEIGIVGLKYGVMTGAQLDKLSDREFLNAVERVSVFARVSPKHKLKIVRALKAKGNIVAMTGDGVNDAPALKEADIGIAMGITGTDVTKEASSMILADDNFATIVAAIEEGRIIYDNIRKFIHYMLACNVGEAATLLFAVLMGLPLPLVPSQILFVNLVTDGLPAIALGLEKGEADVMKRPPRSPNESIFSGGLFKKILFRGLFIAAGTISVFILGLILGDGELNTSRTMAFCALVFFQLFYVFECRADRTPLLQMGLLSNPMLIIAVLSSVLMQLGVVYLPFFQKVFRTVPLNSFHWIVVILVTGLATILNIFCQFALRPIARRVISVRI